MRVGIVGFGSLGRHLFEWVEEHGEQEGLRVAWVWNRSAGALEGVVEEERRLASLEGDIPECELVVEVAHSSVTRKWGRKLLSRASLFMGSPTLLAEQHVHDSLRDAALSSGHTLYVPAGALWGAQDIQRMSRLGNLTSLSISMCKHPDTFKLEDGDVKRALFEYQDDPMLLQPCVIYEGPVRALCPQAPRNVNTMACAALAGPGFDATHATLVADKSLGAHVIRLRVEGANGFYVEVTRHNPAKAGAVTGQATYDSFVSSILATRAGAKGEPLLFC